MLFHKSYASEALAHASSHRAPTLEELAQRVSNFHDIHGGSENMYGEHMDSKGGDNINHGGVASMNTSSGSRKCGSPSVTGARASSNTLRAFEEVYT